MLENHKGHKAQMRLPQPQKRDLAITNPSQDNIISKKHIMLKKKNGTYLLLLSAVILGIITLLVTPNYTKGHNSNTPHSSCSQSYKTKGYPNNHLLSINKKGLNTQSPLDRKKTHKEPETRYPDLTGLLPEVKYGIFNAQNIEDDSMTRVLKEPNHKPKAPRLWGEVSIINGDIVELENGEVIRRTLLDCSKLKEPVVCIEFVDPNGKVIGQEFYDATKAVVRTTAKGHNKAIEKINATSNLIISKTEYFGEELGGIIWMETPSSPHNLFSLPKQILEITDNETKPMLLEFDI
jgi:hypothetical protein